MRRMEAIEMDLEAIVGGDGRMSLCFLRGE